MYSQTPRARVRRLMVDVLDDANWGADLEGCGRPIFWRAFLTASLMRACSRLPTALVESWSRAGSTRDAPSKSQRRRVLAQAEHGGRAQDHHRHRPGTG